MPGYKIALFIFLYFFASLAEGSKCPEDAISKLVVCYYEGESPITNLNICNCTHVVFTNAVKQSENNSISATEGTLGYVDGIKESKKNLTVIFTLEAKSEAVLKSDNKSQQLIDSIFDFLKESQFDGVELNFKFDSDDGISKESFSSFVKNLSKTLSSNHRRVKRDGYDVFEKLQDDITTASYTTQTPKNSTSRAQSIKQRSRKTKESNRKIRENKDEERDADYLTLEEAINTEFSPEKENSLKDVEDGAVVEEKKLYVFVRLSVRPEIIAKKYDLKALSRYADILTIPTHNIVNKDEEHLTYHPSRLMGLADILNTDSVLDFLTGMGGIKSKMVVTMPAGVLKFQLKDENKNTPRSPTVSKPQIIDQSQLCALFSKNNWTLERDDDLTAPYAFSGKTWLAFEDEISVNIKGKYILLRELAGGAIYPIDYDLNDGSCVNRTGSAGYLTGILRRNFESLGRKPRALVLESLQDEIHDVSFVNAQAGVQVSEYRIVRVVDHSGAVHVIRKNTKTQFECSRQGYFSHPLGCNKFYRCVKFDQYSNEFTVFEYDCPAGLAFDERWEVCVWPGSLPHGAPCTGSSEIAPVPRSHYQCPNHEGYFADPENCRWFFACLDHARDGITPLTAYEFRCPFGLVFSEEKLACDWPWLVGSCGNRGAAGYLNINLGGQSQGIHSATFINGGNLEASFGQYDNLDQSGAFVGFGQKFGSGLRESAQGSYQGAQSAGYGYIASQFDDSRDKASFAAFPDYEISGGRIFNKGGVVLDQNIVGGVAGGLGGINIKSANGGYYQLGTTSGIKYQSDSTTVKSSFVETSGVPTSYSTPKPFSVHIPSVQINEEFSTVGSTTPQTLVSVEPPQSIQFADLQQVTGREYSTPRGFTASQSVTVTPTPSSRTEIHRFGQGGLRQGKISAVTGIPVVTQYTSRFGAKETVTVTPKPFEYTVSGFNQQHVTGQSGKSVDVQSIHTGENLVGVGPTEVYSAAGGVSVSVPVVTQKPDIHTFEHTASGFNQPFVSTGFTQQHGQSVGSVASVGVEQAGVPIVTTAVHKSGASGSGEAVSIPIVTPKPGVHTFEYTASGHAVGANQPFVSTQSPGQQQKIFEYGERNAGKSFGFGIPVTSSGYGSRAEGVSVSVPVVTQKPDTHSFEFASGSFNQQQKFGGYGGRKDAGKSVVSFGVGPTEVPLVTVTSSGYSSGASGAEGVSVSVPVVTQKPDAHSFEFTSGGFAQQQKIAGYGQRKGAGNSVVSVGVGPTEVPLVSVTSSGYSSGASGVKEEVSIPVVSQKPGLSTFEFTSGGFDQQQKFAGYGQRKGAGNSVVSVGVGPTEVPLVTVTSSGYSSGASGAEGVSVSIPVVSQKPGLSTFEFTSGGFNQQQKFAEYGGRKDAGLSVGVGPTDVPLVTVTSSGYSSGASGAEGVSVSVPVVTQKPDTHSFEFASGSFNQQKFAGYGGRKDAGQSVGFGPTGVPSISVTSSGHFSGASGAKEGVSVSIPVVTPKYTAVGGNQAFVTTPSPAVAFTQHYSAGQGVVKGLGQSVLSVEVPTGENVIGVGPTGAPFGTVTPTAHLSEYSSSGSAAKKGVSVSIPVVTSKPNSFGYSTPSPVVGFTQQQKLTEYAAGKSFGFGSFVQPTIDDRVSNELKFNTFSIPSYQSGKSKEQQPDLNLSGYYGEHVTQSVPADLPGVTSTVKNNFETADFSKTPVSIPKSGSNGFRFSSSFQQEGKQSYSIPAVGNNGLFKPSELSQSSFGQRYSYSSSFKQGGNQFGVVQPFGAVVSTPKPFVEKTEVFVPKNDQSRTVTEVTVEQQPIVSVGTITDHVSGVNDVNFKSVQPQVFTVTTPAPSISVTPFEEGVSVFKPPQIIKHEETIVNIPGEVNFDQKSPSAGHVTYTQSSSAFDKTGYLSSQQITGNQILEQPKNQQRVQITTGVTGKAFTPREQLVGLEITKSIEVNPEEFFQTSQGQQEEFYQRELPAVTPKPVVSTAEPPVIYSEGSLPVFEPSKIPLVGKTETKYLPPSGFVRNSAKSGFVQTNRFNILTPTSTELPPVTLFGSKKINFEPQSTPKPIFNPEYAFRQNFTTGSRFASGFKYAVNPNIEIPEPPREYILQQNGYTTAAPELSTIHFQSVSNRYETSSPSPDLDEQSLVDKYSGSFGQVIGGEGSSTVRYEISSTTPKPKTRGRLYHGDITSNRATNKYEEYDISDDRGSSAKTTIDLKNLKVDKDKKTVIVVSQVSDANPVLIGKLAGQCSCQSNMLELRSKGKKSKGGLRRKNKISTPQHSLITNEYLPPYEGSQSKIDIETVTTGSSTAEPVIIGGEISSTTASPVSSTILSSLGSDGVLSITPKALFTEQRVRSKSKQFRGRTRYLPPSSLLSEDGSGVRLLSPVPASEIASTIDYSIVKGEESRSQNEIDGGKLGGGAAFDRYGPGGWRGFDETLQGSIDCKRPGLFRHPKHCNKFYACNYDPWKEQYTLHVFNCPIHLTYDSSISACNWPVRGPACADDNLLV